MLRAAVAILDIEDSECLELLEIGLMMLTLDVAIASASKRCSNPLPRGSERSGLVCASPGMAGPSALGLEVAATFAPTSEASEAGEVSSRRLVSSTEDLELARSAGGSSLPMASRVA